MYGNAIVKNCDSRNTNHIISECIIQLSIFESQTEISMPNEVVAAER